MVKKLMSVENLTLHIATPKGVFTADFPKTAKVEEVIHAAVKAKGLSGSDDLELIHDGETLEPVERPLTSFGLEGTVQLELVAQGSGV